MATPQQQQQQPIDNVEIDASCLLHLLPGSKTWGLGMDEAASQLRVGVRATLETVTLYEEDKAKESRLIWEFVSARTATRVF